MWDLGTAGFGGRPRIASTVRSSRPCCGESGPRIVGLQGQFQDLVHVLHVVHGHALAHRPGQSEIRHVLGVVLGQDHGGDVTPVGGQDLLLEPADGKDPAAQGDLSGHRHVLPHRDAHQSAEDRAVAMVMPADGPSLGMAPSGTWMWMSIF